MTPPALAITSGMTKMPLSLRISSACGVVGEFAPSITIRQSRRSALSAWIMPPRPSNLANAPGAWC
jgi:hypothetical protein